MEYNCPDINCRQIYRGYSFAHIGISLEQQDHKGVVDTNLILLDTCSTESVCNNKQLLKDTKQCKIYEVLHIVTNGVSQTYDMMGTFNIIPIFAQYNPESLSTLFYLNMPHQLHERG